MVKLVRIIGSFIIAVFTLSIPMLTGLSFCLGWAPFIRLLCIMFLLIEVIGLSEYIYYFTEDRLSGCHQKYISYNEQMFAKEKEI